MDLGSHALSTLGWLDPLTVLGRNPYGAEEPPDATLGIGTVMLAHDRYDGLSSFFTMVKWHLGEVMVDNMRLDNAVHEVAANETKVAVNCRGSTTGESPCIRIVVGKGRIGVLQVRYPYCQSVSKSEGRWKG